MTKHNKPLACSALSDNHSDDRTLVHYGAPAPALLCGFHATYLAPRDYDTMRAGGTLPTYAHTGFEAGAL